MQRLLRMHIFDAGHTQRGDFEDNSLSRWRVRMIVGIKVDFYALPRLQGRAAKYKFLHLPERRTTNTMKARVLRQWKYLNSDLISGLTRG